MKCAAVFLTDKHYLDLTRQAAVAFMQTNKMDIIIYLDGLSIASDKDIENAARDAKVNIQFCQLDISNQLGISFRKSTHLKSSIINKFFAINNACRHYDRIVYIDSDIIVFKNINLEKIDFHGNPLAAVYDIAEMGGMTDIRFFDNIKENDLSKHYFNSGFICIDCSKWDEKDFTDRYISYVESHSSFCGYKENCVTIDQCALNLLFRDRWTRLPLNFNMQACAIFCDSWATASVRHYVGRRKFYPPRAGRTDQRDLDILNRVQAILRRKRIYLPLANILYQINKMRHAKHGRRTDHLIRELDCAASPHR